MGSSEDLSFEGIEKMPLREYTEKAYMDYSMYVILDRALPHIGDGLKPVQRRIVYAMSELGLKATAKYKKSARTVGDVLGKFHPHGDSACYQAMVLMAQPFSYRYPLVDGQGNWGSPDDPKSFAAMRYTESKLSAYSEVLLSEVGLGTVDWNQNFDGTLKEPAVLPARLPNLLLNGTTGIAVGMATDIPPHNLKEIANATITLMDNPEAGTRTLFKYFKGPDYPTKAEIITPREDIIKMYEKGTGSVKMRAITHYESGDIVITALPFQVSGSKIMEQIAAQMNKKKLPMVTDLRDESDHDDPVRFVIVPKSNRVDKEALMAHLFATTDLEQSYRVNMNVIGLNGKPGVRNLVEILREWLEFRTDVVKRRLNHRLEKVLSRLHILDGLLIAFLNIDEVIKIIRTEDKPKPVLMKRFKLSDIQAEAILELKLRHLARLEEMKINGEQDELTIEKNYLEATLGSEDKLKDLIRTEIKEDSKKYGDKRNSPVIEREEAVAISESEMLPTEPITVILSQNGWIRSAKGHEIDMSKIKFKAGDDLLTSISAKSNQEILFIESSGKAYSLEAHTLPSARGFGEPLTGRLSLPDRSKIESLIVNEPGSYMLLASDAGYGFVVKTSDMMTKNRNGKALITLPENACVMNPIPVNDLENDRVLVITNEGRMLVFPVKDLPLLSKGKGNKIIDIPARRARIGIELLKCLTVIPGECDIKVHSGQRFFVLKGDSISQFEGVRGRRGKKLPRGFQNVRLVEVEGEDKVEGEEKKEISE